MVAQQKLVTNAHDVQMGEVLGAFVANFDDTIVVGAPGVEIRIGGWSTRVELCDFRLTDVFRIAIGSGRSDLHLPR
jgi:hypothetical protein